MRLDLRISPQILKQNLNDPNNISGAWGKQKSRDTGPLNNFFNRRKFRVFKGLSIDIEEEGEGSDRTECQLLLLNYAAQVYEDIVKGMKAVCFPSWMSASSVELIRHHKPCLLTDNWLICDIFLQIADTVKDTVFLPSVSCHSHTDGSNQEQFLDYGSKGSVRDL